MGGSYYFSEPLTPEEGKALGHKVSREELLNGWKWDGVYKDFTNTEYWCPTKNEWTMCSGPCPDDTPHSETREITTTMKVMVRK